MGPRGCAMCGRASSGRCAPCSRTPSALYTAEVEETRETLPAESTSAERCNCAAARWLGGWLMYCLGATACILTILVAIVNPADFDMGLTGALGAMILLGWFVAHPLAFSATDRWRTPQTYVALAAGLLGVGAGLAALISNVAAY